MSAKFFIYAGRRWRELETESGRLSGWGRAKFVFLRHGRLVVARRGPVLRALRALATGRGVAARDGLPLRKYEPPAAANEKKKDKSPAPVSCKECQRHHEHVVLPQHCTQCMNNARFDRLVNLNTNTVGTQFVATANASTQVTQSLTNRRPSINNSNDNLPLAGIPLVDTARITEKTLEAQTGKPKVNSKQQSVDILRKKTDKSSINRKRKRSPSSGSTSTIVTYSQKNSADDVKELVIDEKDVEILREFLLKNNFGVDVEQFDKSEAYKEKVFYSINPLVVIERCPRIKLMLAERQNPVSNPNGVSIKQFMTVLGLQTVEERKSQERRYKTRARVSQIMTSMSHKDVFMSENNKENESVPKKIEHKAEKKPAKVLREDNVRFNHLKLLSQEIVKGRQPLSKAQISSPRGQAHILQDRVVELSSESSSSSSSSSEGGAFQAPPSVAPSRSTHVNSGPGGSSGGGKVRGGGMREYSALEDAAIVSWIRAGNRARLVNGNRLWRELQTEYPELTGQVRSWHSLRNRYLRYILPALQHFALPRDATRLRADAAAGELKSRKPQSQNSMLVLPRVRSALARRHRTRRLSARSTTTPSPMPTPCPTRSHRQARPNASTPKSPEKSTLPKRTPMYSELTRHFANVNDENSSDDFERTEAKAYPRERTSPIYRLRGRATPQSISTAESRSQRYSRRSTRNNTNKQPSPDHSLKEDAPRKRRRLYNPTTVL
ncbi:unnamed protein product [Parnassius apollo]|uniref:Telomeric repeat-binding factor 2-interacting protein 1 n=1 Tax=Parnassius apollo TaxID=110799 RepID=A0A8S3WFX3_PARAO|nr:unnamed protein product [Parnassius apollo]